MRRTALLALLGLVACASPAPPPLSVSLDQSRDLENRHLVAVRLVNEGPDPVEVVRLQLRSDAWSSVPPTVRPEVLAPGQRLAFPVAYGAADCAVEAPATVVVGYRRDGVLREARVPVPADDPLLPRLHARECDLAALARTADLALGSFARRGDVAVGELVVQRRRPGAVRVVAVDGSVILTARTPAALPAALDDGLRLPVEVAPTRCDPHALAESKRTYVFAVAVQRGDEEPLTVAVTPDDTAVLEQLVQDVCLD